MKFKTFEAMLEYLKGLPPGTVYKAISDEGKPDDLTVTVALNRKETAK